jgi:amino-acid N-acetyltransferase
MTSRPLAFRTATPADDAALRALLERVGLPAADVATGPRQRYVLAFDGARLVGSVGLELAGGDALARSLAVVPELRARGLATALNERVLELARELGVRDVYLLTTTAAGFAARRGYEPVARGEVPDAVAGLAQFRTLCPATAACMRRRVAGR